MKKFVTDWAAKSGPGGHLSAFTGEKFSDAGAQSIIAAYAV
jgi:hypothetical protein